MATIKLKFVVEDTDRHGNARLYFRRRGRKKIRLHGMPGSDEFMQAYKIALAGSFVAEEPAAPREAVKGSLKWLCEGYYKTVEYQQLDDRTKRVRRNILDDLCRRHGEKPAELMEPRHVRQLRDEKANRPEAANAMVKALRQVFAVGVERDLITRNAAREVPYLRSKSFGFHSWTEEEITAFETRYPIGTQARLALALLLYTGQRRSDVVKFGRQHLRDGSLCFTQHKNRKSKPVTLQLPIVQELRKVIDASQCGDLTFLVTAFGKPFSSAGFGNRFRQWCNDAGLKHCSAHGLRKAAAARLAELGATENEIMALTGHRTSKEVTRYTRAARQKVLAERAMSKLAAGQKGNKSVPPGGGKPGGWDTNQG